MATEADAERANRCIAGCSALLRHQPKIRTFAACTIELTPALERNVAVAVGNIDFGAGKHRDGFQGVFGTRLAGVVGAVVGGVCKHRPAATPLSVGFGTDAAVATRCFKDSDITAAFDGFRTGVKQPGVQALAGIARAPALDERAETGSGQGCQHVRNGQDDHGFNKGEAVRLTTA